MFAPEGAVIYIIKKDIQYSRSTNHGLLHAASCSSLSILHLLIAPFARFPQTATTHQFDAVLASFSVLQQVANLGSVHSLLATSVPQNSVVDIRDGIFECSVTFGVLQIARCYM